MYVWGLNDKDQLGGVKGSKVKVPVFSPVLSALRPVHIAGGSKTLFIVSHDGKVSSSIKLITCTSSCSSSIHYYLFKKVMPHHKHLTLKIT